MRDEGGSNPSWGASHCVRSTLGKGCHEVIHTFDIFTGGSLQETGRNVSVAGPGIDSAVASLFLSLQADDPQTRIGPTGKVVYSKGLCYVYRHPRPGR